MGKRCKILGCALRMLKNVKIVTRALALDPVPSTHYPASPYSPLGLLGIPQRLLSTKLDDGIVFGGPCGV